MWVVAGQTVSHVGQSLSTCGTHSSVDGEEREDILLIVLSVEASD